MQSSKGDARPDAGAVQDHGRGRCAARPSGRRGAHVALAAASLAASLTLAAHPAAAGPAVHAARGQAQDCTPSPGYTHCVAYYATGGNQTFTVPAGVTSLRATLNGADGGRGAAGEGGGGGRTEGTVAVRPSQQFDITVGVSGAYRSSVSGYGGGGAGINSWNSGAGTGGGMSALWDGAAFGPTPLLIAGGGGGGSGSGSGSGQGGPGGGDSGGAGNGASSVSGKGGTQSGGGAGGVSSDASCPAASSGTRYQGGTGTLTSGSFPYVPGAGGGGGGGYYGGGGGGASCYASTTESGPGGGGSGYLSGPGVTDATTTQGVAQGSSCDGQVRLEWN